MNQRLYDRNIYKIPMLLAHIKRAKKNKQPDRVAGFQDEYDRRYKQMVDAGHKAVIDKLVKAKKAKLAKAK